MGALEEDSAYDMMVTSRTQGRLLERENDQSRMESFRAYAVAVASRSLLLAVVAATLLAIFGHSAVTALASFAGTLVGLAYLFHIAASFNRLAKGGKGYLPFLTVESLLRVMLAGAAPFVIVGRGPALGYFVYLAGFVAPLAVAILVYKQQIVDGRAKTSTPSQAP